MADTESNVVKKVEIELVGNLQLFIGSLREARQSTRQTARYLRQDFKDVVDSMAEVNRGAMRLKGAFVEIGAALGIGLSTYKAIAFFEEITKLAGRVEVLEVVSENMGRTAGYTSEQIRRFVNEIKALNITTQQANLSVTKFIQAGLQLDKVAEVAMVARDAGVIMGFSTQEALAGIVHGIITLQPEVLRTYGIISNLEVAYRKQARQMGISYDDMAQSVKQQVALNEVLKIGARLQGTYETAMTKPHKQMLSLIRVTEEFKVSMGRQFQELFSNIVLKMTDFLTVGKDSEELKEVFRGVANAALNLFNTLIAMGEWVVRNRGWLSTMFQAWILLKFGWAVKFVVAWFGKMMGMFVGAGVATIPRFIQVMTMGRATLGKFAVTMKVAVQWAGSLGTALGFLTAKFPVVLQIMIGLLGVLTVAFAKAGFIASVAWTKILGPIGIILAVASAVGLLVTATNDLTEASSESDWAQKQLQGDAVKTAYEYLSLRTQAVFLMQDFLALAKTQGITADTTEDLQKIFDQLQSTTPDLVTGITNLKDAFDHFNEVEPMENARIAELTIARLNSELNKTAENLKSQTLKLKHDATAFVDSVGQPFGELVAFQKKVEGLFEKAKFGDPLADQFKEVTTTFNTESKKLSETITDLVNAGADASGFEELRGWYTDAFDQALSLYSIEEKRLKTQKEIDRIKAEGLLRGEGEGDLPEGRDIIKRREDTLKEAAVRIERLNESLADTELGKEKARLQRELVEYGNFLSQMASLGLQKTQEYQEIRKKIADYDKKEGTRILRESELKEMARQESLLKITSRANLTGLRNLANFYEQKMLLLDTSNEDEKNLYDTYEADRIAVLDRINNLEEKHIKMYSENQVKALETLLERWKTGLQKMIEEGGKDTEEYFELHSQIISGESQLAEARVKLWAEKNELVIKSIRVVEQAWDTMIDTVVDLEMTGAERIKKIWQSLLKAFIDVISEQIKWILFRNSLQFGFGSIFQLFGAPARGGTGGTIVGGGFRGGGAIIKSIGNGGDPFHKEIVRLMDSLGSLQQSVIVTIPPVQVVSSEGIYLAGVTGQRTRRIVTIG